jgi:hypothetical protein
MPSHPTSLHIDRLHAEGQPQSYVLEKRCCHRLWLKCRNIRRFRCSLCILSCSFVAATLVMTVLTAFILATLAYFRFYSFYLSRLLKDWMQENAKWYSEACKPDAAYTEIAAWLAQCKKAKNDVSTNTFHYMNMITAEARTEAWASWVAHYNPRIWLQHSTLQDTQELVLGALQAAQFWLIEHRDELTCLGMAVLSLACVWACCRRCLANHYRVMRDIWGREEALCSCCGKLMGVDKCSCEITASPSWTSITHAAEGQEQSAVGESGWSPHTSTPFSPLPSAPILTARHSASQFSPLSRRIHSTRS